MPSDFAQSIARRYDLRTYVRDSKGRFAGKSGSGLTSSDMRADIPGGGSMSGREFAYAVGTRLGEKWTPSNETLDLLAKEEGWSGGVTKEEAVGRIMQRWTGSSGGDLANVMIEGAAQEAGLSLDIRKNDWMDAHPVFRDDFRDLGKIMYKDTQSYLKDKGISSLDLHRKGLPNEKSPYTSWSTSAGGFITTDTSRVSVHASIPARNILSLSNTGFGNVVEGEVVVMGNATGYVVSDDGLSLSKSADFEHHRRVLELASLWFYSDIRRIYWERIYDAIVGFLKGKSARTAFENEMKKAMADAFVQAAEQAWTDAGAELPLESDALAYVGGVQSGELGYIGDLFANLVLLRKETGELAQFTAQDTAATKADGYAHTLDAVYANVKLLAKPNVMLTFAGSDGTESCADCSRLKGKRHRAKWWVANDAVPPSRHFECKGYRCQHHLVDDDGNLYTI